MQQPDPWQQSFPWASSSSWYAILTEEAICTRAKVQIPLTQQSSPKQHVSPKQQLGPEPPGMMTILSLQVPVSQSIGGNSITTASTATVNETSMSIVGGIIAGCAIPHPSISAQPGCGMHLLATVTENT